MTDEPLAGAAPPPNEATTEERAAMDQHLREHADRRVKHAVGVEECRPAYLVGIERRRERRERIRNVMLALVVALGMWSSFSSVQYQTEAKDLAIGNRELLVKMDKALGRIEDINSVATGFGSPESRAADLKAILDAFATRLDCNTRQALLDAIDAIGDVFGQAAANEYKAKIAALCATAPPSQATPPSGTTTTTPG